MASSEAQKAEQPVEVVVERYISKGIGGRGNLLDAGFTWRFPQFFEFVY